MLNKTFLNREEVVRYIDTIHFKTQYIRITILDNTNTPLRAIEGRATGGNININGSSSVRRTGSLTLVTEHIEDPKHPLDVMNAVTNINTLISMNKRVKVEIGIKNNGHLYPEYSMFWFTLGTYMIQDAAVTYNLQQGIQISLTLMDKMALLNGEMGGVFDASITHSPEGEYPSGTQKIVEKGVKVRTLVEMLVHDYGGLNASEIYVEDIPNQIENRIRWINKSYNLKIQDDTLSLVPTASANSIGYGEDFGMTLTDFIFPLKNKLESKAGEVVTTVLDQIKKELGNYEYYFDEEGIFHFKQLDTYEYDGSPIEDLTEALADKYFFNTLKSKSKYSFKDAKLVSSYQNKPRYSQIKNDFVVWGKANDKRDIRYHLRLQAITNEHRYLLWQVGFDTQTVTDLDGNVETIYYIKVARPTSRAQSGFITEAIEEGDKIVVTNKDGSTSTLPTYFINLGATQRPGRNDHVKDDDWRLMTYLMAINMYEASRTPFDKELITQLPVLYALELNQQEYDDIANVFFAPRFTNEQIAELPYWLDVINTNDATLMQTVDLKQFGIETIGKRTKVLSDDEVNCLFATKTPEEIAKYQFVEGDFFNYNPNGKDANGNPVIIFTIPANYTLTTPEGRDILFWVDCVGLGTIEKPAFDLLRSSLHEYLSYSNNINIQVLPVYHLDANQRITVENKESDIYGDYVINTISLPLALNGMMTINARKAVERI